MIIQDVLMTELVIKGTVVFEDDYSFEKTNEFLEDFEKFLLDHHVELNGIVRSYQFNENEILNET